MAAIPSYCFKIGLRSAFKRSSLFFHLNNEAKRFIHTSALLNVQGQPIKMPSLSPTMEEGTIVKWLKQEGDPVQPGDVICDIQTDKAVVSFEIEEEGILAKILVKEDTSEIKIGTLIALFVGEGEDWKNVEIPPVEDDAEPSPAQEQLQSTVKLAGDAAIKHKFGPSVHLLLQKYGLLPEEVPPGGPHGRLLKGDVLKIIKERNLLPKQLEVPPPPPTPSLPKSPKVSASKEAAKSLPGEEGVYTDIELSNMRRTIAKRLSQSKSTIAHNYASLECRIDELLKLQKQFKKDGFPVSVNDFIIKAAAVALTRCPEINSIWENGNLISKDFVDISVAVSTNAGLITPIVKNANTLGLADISSTIKDLAIRARENKLKLDEFQGGTFTISNLGMFGISEFTAVINPPQCAILAVGGGRPSLGLDAHPEILMSATLSYDRSAISEDDAALFMETLKGILEDPSSILLGSYARKVDHPLSGLL